MRKMILLLTFFVLWMPQGARGGTLTGRILFDGDIPAPIYYTPSRDTQVCGTGDHVSDEMVVGADKGIGYAVVSLKNVDGGRMNAQASVILDQQGCRFQPHVVLIPRGATLEILNNDKILHNVRTTSKKNPPFNKAQPKFLKKIKHTFKAAPEKIKVQCDAHSWMSAWIVVQEPPFYAVTNASGQFTLTDVPAGTYTIESWHEKLGVQTATVTVPATGTVTADFTFKGE